MADYTRLQEEKQCAKTKTGREIDTDRRTHTVKTASVKLHHRLAVHIHLKCLFQYRLLEGNGQSFKTVALKYCHQKLAMSGYSDSLFSTAFMYNQHSVCVNV